VEKELEFSVSHTFGGNSSCVQLETDGADHVLCDLGSGARSFGNSLLATPRPLWAPLSTSSCPPALGPHHGLPFFMPAYLPGKHVTIYGATTRWRRRSAGRTAPVLPGGLLEDGSADRVRALEPSATTTSRGCGCGPSASTTAAIPTATVSSTAARSSSTPPIPSTSRTTRRVAAFVEFFRDADLVIFDASTRSPTRSRVKEDWGHSSNVGGRGDVPARASPPPLSLSPRADVRRRAHRRLLAETRRLEEINADRSPGGGLGRLRRPGAGALRRRPERRPARPTARGRFHAVGGAGSGPARSWAGAGRPAGGAPVGRAPARASAAPAAGAPVAARDRVRPPTRASTRVPAA